ncbi:MAG: glycogen debranching N-terminal domain-containing protein [Terriglobales bacterium]
MSTRPATPRRNDELVPIPNPHQEPRVVYQAFEPRKVNNLTLVDGKTFLSTTVSGDINPPGAPDVGFFHDDTRFLSQLELRIGGQRTVVLSSSTEKTFASQIELTTGNITLRDSFDLPENTIHIRREQLLSSGVFFDRLTFENFNLSPVEFVIEMKFDSDFVDVFQVRGVARSQHGQFFRPIVQKGSIRFVYHGLDDRWRTTDVRFLPEPHNIENETARWSIKLPPSRRFDIQIKVEPFVSPGKGPDFTADTKNTKDQLNFSDSLRFRRHSYARWESGVTKFASSNEVFTNVLSTATSDFHALLIPDAKESIIAAGIPWFATLFGRDSIIAAYQSLALQPQLAVDTLRILAHYQGTEVADWYDQQPGKILHEYRTGEMVRHHEMPFGPYYGSVDSTPLFLILLSETFNWTADEKLVQDLLPNVYRALEWIDRYGDIDGDGFVEYQRRSPRGLVNQGWKDSWDAIMHRDGSIAQTPVALVEVQAYVYEAKYRMASLLRHFGDIATADRLKREATELQRRFEKVFWMPKQNFYAMALDKDKKQVQVINSNAGHLLFCRIVSKERARTITQRFMAEDMFSGWGWRTLASSEPVFNPLSYHRGSVWPHDNSLIAHGMALNEMRSGAIRCLTSLYQASVNFRDYRLPELFCGVQRGEYDEPVHYPVSCSPQAWASGAMFLMLTSVLGIRPSAQKRELNIVNPVLPPWLEFLYLRNMRIGNSRVGLDFTRRGERTFCNVVDLEGDKLMVNVVFKKDR